MGCMFVNVTCTQCSQLHCTAVRVVINNLLRKRMARVCAFLGITNLSYPPQKRVSQPADPADPGEKQFTRCDGWPINRLGRRGRRGRRTTTHRRLPQPAAGQAEND